MARRKILLNYPNIKTLRGHLVTFLPDKPKLKTATLELPYLSSGYSVVKIWHTNENVFTNPVITPDGEYTYYLVYEYMEDETFDNQDYDFETEVLLEHVFS